MPCSEDTTKGSAAAPSFSLSEEDAARAVERELAAPTRVLVFSHIRPDGDAAGSSLALASILRAAGHEAEVVLSDRMARQFRFLPDAGRVRTPAEVEAGAGAPRGGDGGGKGGAAFPLVFPLVFALDTSTHERLGSAAPLFDAASRSVCIDHHVSCSLRADVNWIDPGAAAVGEMIWRLARTLGLEVTPGARDALYLALMTDTGRFTFGNTTADTLEIAAALVRAGADPEVIATHVYGEKPLGEWELDCRARRSLRLEEDGRVATLCLSWRDFEETGTTPSSTEDLTALSRLVAGVEVGLFFKEIDGGKRTKVGIRTVRGVDANRLASRMGGGGHPQASGCTVDAPLDEARRKVLAEAGEFLEEAAAEREKGPRRRGRR